MYFYLEMYILFSKELIKSDSTDRFLFQMKTAKNFALPSQE